MKGPYSFMMVDTRPTAHTAHLTFKKNFDEPIMSAAFINNDS